VSGFSIGEVVARTGVAEATLRMWELRHGLPAPERLPSGHRRYSESDMELVRRVAAERAGGVSLAVAIERSRHRPETGDASLYATLRRYRPDLEASMLPKHLLLALTHAIEDESVSRAERPLLFASFQRECYYRHGEARWRELSRGAELSLVFADFQCPRSSPGSPTEVPIEREHPLSREWSVVCEAAGHAVCLVAWEPPSSACAPASQRHFESIWSVEPEVVRQAAQICVGIAAATLGESLASTRRRLDAQPARPAGEQLRLAAAITNRALSYAA
jgi:MerR family transcriptional regulator, light-induced transcriptional regulator